MALKLRAQTRQARRSRVLLPNSFGLTNAILPYLEAPVSFKRMLESPHRSTPEEPRSNSRCCGRPADSPDG